MERHTPFLTSLLAGGLAGTSVDLALFPIDTLKTRLQSPYGFLAAGGFRGVYRGVLAAAIGSAPGAALFFSTYETMKPIISSQLRGGDNSSAAAAAPTHMISASIGESVACLIRVPTEVIKSKMQTNAIGSSSLSSTIRTVLAERDGRAVGSNVLGGLYRGLGITLMREVPFAFIQFPIYERLKLEWKKTKSRHDDGLVVECSPIQAAACGSIAGGIAAAITCPLDVIKTRLMLGTDKLGVPYLGVGDVVQRLAKEEGKAIFFSGIQPRVMWISIGGFVFFGAYETYRSFLMSSSSPYNS
jgi:solute carrier family 25 S-adenosylmethionine transporter 26